MAQPIAIALPFNLDPSGAVAQNASSTGQLSDRVTALASTIPGTRVMASGFGVNTQRLLFLPGNSMYETEIANDLKVKLPVYEPGAVLTSVLPVSDPSGTGVAGIVCTATRRDSATAAGASSTRVRIGVGGTVTDYASTTAL